MSARDVDGTKLKATGETSGGERPKAVSGEGARIPTTRLSRHTTDAIAYRDRDLVSEVLGYRSFTEALFY
jgi:hypothetical protein